MTVVFGFVRTHIHVTHRCSPTLVVVTDKSINLREGHHRGPIDDLAINLGCKSVRTP